MVSTIEERIGGLRLKLPTDEQVAIEVKGGFNEGLVFRCLCWIGVDVEDTAKKLGVSPETLGSWIATERTKLTEESKYRLMRVSLA